MLLRHCKAVCLALAPYLQPAQVHMASTWRAWVSSGDLPVQASCRLQSHAGQCSEQAVAAVCQKRSWVDKTYTALELDLFGEFQVLHALSCSWPMAGLAGRNTGACAPVGMLDRYHRPWLYLRNLSFAVNCLRPACEWSAITQHNHSKSIGIMWKPLGTGMGDVMRSQLPAA